MIGIISIFIMTASPATGIVADRILAVVNNDVISLSDVQEYREVFMRTAPPDDSDVLKQLVNQKLLLIEAKKLEIAPPSTQEVAAAYNVLRAGFGRPETFELLKQRLSVTDEELEQQIEEKLLAQKLVQERITFFVFVRPEEIQTYYDDHPDEFKNQPLDKAEPQINKILTAEKGRQKLEDYLGRLRAKADIRINRMPVE